MSLKFHPKLHSELINLCTNGGTMENCKEFQEIAALLNTTNDFVKDFSKIRFKGGEFFAILPLKLLRSLTYHLSFRK